MSASKRSLLMRGLQALLQFMRGQGPATPVEPVACEVVTQIQAVAASSADAMVADASTVATTAPLVIVAMPNPFAASTVARRPLAAQLAVTASRTRRKDRKGRKVATSAQRQPQQATLPRKATALKAKPSKTVMQKKRSAKRRHVWLSTQSRVIKPVTMNVVAMPIAGRSTRTVLRPAAKAAPRQLRLAA